jgi:hypothetical protein
MSVLRLTPEQYQAHLDRLKVSQPDAIDVPVVEKKTGLAIMLADEPVAAPQTPLQRMQALGRLKQGEMNGTEKAYDALLASRKHAGEIVWYAFEAITFVLEGGVRYTPDFIVQLATGEIEVHEVKGFWTDDARVKVRMAQGRFPFRFLAIMGKKKKGQYTWTIEDFWKW